MKPTNTTVYSPEPRAEVYRLRLIYRNRAVISWDLNSVNPLKNEVKIKTPSGAQQKLRYIVARHSQNVHAPTVAPLRARFCAW